MLIQAAAEVRGIAVTGSGMGIVAAGARGIVIADVWVHDLADRGIGVEMPGIPTEVSVRHVLVERVRYFGIGTIGGELHVERSVVRDVNARTGESSGGNGLYAGLHPVDPKRRGALTVVATMVERARESGASTVGGVLDIEGSVLSKNVARSDGTHGEGVSAVRDKKTGTRAELRLRRSAILANHSFGVLTLGATATLEDVTVEGTEPRPDGLLGRGVMFHTSDGSIARSSILNNVEVGIALVASGVTLRELLFRDTRAKDGVGIGLFISADEETATPSAVTIDESLILRSVSNGIHLSGGTLEVRACNVRETAATAAAEFGDALSVTPFVKQGGLAIVPASLVVERSLLDRSGRGGLAIWGSEVTLRTTRIACNALDLNVEERFALVGSNVLTRPVALTDDGGNVCGCDAPATCHASSSGISPVSLTTDTP